MPVVPGLSDRYVTLNLALYYGHGHVYVHFGIEHEVDLGDLSGLPEMVCD